MTQLSTDEQTINFEELTTSAQDKIIHQDPDEQFTWYAKPHGKGYQVRSVQENLLDLLEAQGGMNPGWLRVQAQNEEPLALIPGTATGITESDVALWCDFNLEDVE